MLKKKYKEIKMCQSSYYPESKKERQKLYRLLEGIGLMRMFLTSEQVIFRQEIK